MTLMTLSETSLHSHRGHYSAVPQPEKNFRKSVECYITFSLGKSKIWWWIVRLNLKQLNRKILCCPSKAHDQHDHIPQLIITCVSLPGRDMWLSQRPTLPNKPLIGQWAVKCQLWTASTCYLEIWKLIWVHQYLASYWVNITHFNWHPCLLEIKPNRWEHICMAIRCF